MAICQEYIPTEWFDNTAPAINAANLNHIELGVQQATDCSITQGGQIDDLDQRVTDLESQDFVPSGVITAFAPNRTIPSGWAICDGQNGTPDLRDKFIYGCISGEDGTTGGSADAIVVSHSHTFTGNPLSPHTHYYEAWNYDPNTGGLCHEPGCATNTTYGGKNVASESAGTPSGTVNATGSSGTDKNLPPYMKLMYIMKL